MTERRLELPLDLRVQPALVVAEAGLDMTADVVNDGLGLTGLDGIERRSRHGGRCDLVDVERGGEVGVDEADMDADDLCALTLELDTCRIREAPGCGDQRSGRGSGAHLQLPYHASQRPDPARPDRGRYR